MKCGRYLIYNIFLKKPSDFEVISINVELSKSINIFIFTVVFVSFYQKIRGRRV